MTNPQNWIDYVTNVPHEFKSPSQPSFGILCDSPPEGTAAHIWTAFLSHCVSKKQLNKWTASGVIFAYAEWQHSFKLLSWFKKINNFQCSWNSCSTQCEVPLESGNTAVNTSLTMTKWVQKIAAKLSETKSVSKIGPTYIFKKNVDKQFIFIKLPYFMLECVMRQKFESYQVTMYMYFTFQ